MTSHEITPDQSQFDAMNAAAAGPEAGDRRVEMNQWAEHQGALAEGAAKLHNKREAQLGYPDAHPDLRRLSETIADQGVPVSRDVGKFNVRSTNKALPSGVEVNYEDGQVILRSPTAIAADKNKTQKAA